MVRTFPGVFLLLFVVLGVVVADGAGLPSWALMLLVVVEAAVGVYLLLAGRAVAAGVLLALAIGCFAGYRFSADVLDRGPYDLSRFLENGFKGQVFGTVADWPEVRSDRTDILVAVDSLRGDFAQRVSGRVLLKISDTTTSLQRGDGLEFMARLYPLPMGKAGEFDYGRYLSLKGVRAVAYLPTALDIRMIRRSDFGYVGVVDKLRGAVMGSLHRTLSPEAAALAGGFLIGETRDIAPDVYRRFRDSGTLHVLAVSGSNVALVLLFVSLLVRPLGWSRPRRAAVYLVVLVLFAGLCYGDPSVMRATVMAALVLWARLLGRAYDLNNVIAVTAVIVLLVAPAQLFDIGFQLSFVTAWGLILLVPRFTTLFTAYHQRWWYRMGVFPLVVAVVAQVCSAPLIVYHFGRLSLVAVPANLVVVPAVTVAVMGSMALLLADLILPLLGLWVGSLLDFWMRLIVLLLQYLGGEIAAMGAVGGDGGASTGLLTLSTVVMSYVIIWLAAVSPRSKRARRWLVLALLVAVNVVLAAGVKSALEGAEDRCYLCRIPGGVAAVVPGDRAEAPDLVLTGVARTDYPLDERILVPLVRQTGAEQCARVFVLGADFGAIDDLLRGASALAADTLYVPIGLAASIVDVARGLDLEEWPEVCYFSGDSVSMAGDGFRLSESGIGLRRGGGELLFVDRVTAERLERPASVPGSGLVVGTAWFPRPEDLVVLQRLGYDRLMCARVLQPIGTEFWEPSLDVDHVSSELVLDLSRSGGVWIGLHNFKRD